MIRGMDYKTYLASNEKRRLAIVALRAKHWTWTAIGDRFGISRQRAEQIAKAGPSKRNGKKGAP